MSIDVTAQCADSRRKDKDFFRTLQIILVEFLYFNTIFNILLKI